MHVNYMHTFSERLDPAVAGSWSPRSQQLVYTASDSESVEVAADELLWERRFSWGISGDRGSCALCADGLLLE